MILAMDERPKEEMEAALNLIATFPDRHGNSLKVGGAVVHYNKEMWDRLFTVTPHLSALANEEIPQELFREIGPQAEAGRKADKHLQYDP